MSMTENIREAIARSQLSLYLIEQETDVLYPALRNLMAGKGGVRLSTADKLAAYFGLRLVHAGDESPAEEQTTTIAERLRAAIQRSGQSIQEIQHASGVRSDALARFLAGQQDLLLTTADKLAAHFGLHLSGEPIGVLATAAGH
jgi:plasmid maintenance system antidote protein VapI